MPSLPGFGSAPWPPLAAATAPAIPPVRPAPAAGMSTRQQAIAADKAALVHIFEVLTDTLRPSSKKANPYHLIRDNVTIDTTSDFFALDQDFLDADIPLYSDYDNDVLQLDAKGKAMTFTLGTKEKQRLLAIVPALLAPTLKRGHVALSATTKSSVIARLGISSNAAFLLRPIYMESVIFLM